MELFIFTDGGSRGNPGPAAIGGLVCRDSVTGESIHEFSEYLGEGTNNEAEYTAFLTSLKWLSLYENKEAITACTWHLDSKLVVEQINKKWKVKDQRMRTFAQNAWELLDQFSFQKKVMYVPRAQNAAADALVNQALDAHAT